MEVIQEENKDAFQYLKDIDKKLWTRVYTLYPKLGHDTSNIIESLNRVWHNIREMQLLQMMDAIYTYLMKLVYKQLKQEQGS